MLISFPSKKFTADCPVNTFIPSWTYIKTFNPPLHNALAVLPCAFSFPLSFKQLKKEKETFSCHHTPFFLRTEKKKKKKKNSRYKKTTKLPPLLSLSHTPYFFTHIYSNLEVVNQ